MGSLTQSLRRTAEQEGCGLAVGRPWAEALQPDRPPRGPVPWDAATRGQLWTVDTRRALGTHRPLPTLVLRSGIEDLGREVPGNSGEGNASSIGSVRTQLSRLALRGGQTPRALSRVLTTHPGVPQGGRQSESDSREAGEAGNGRHQLFAGGWAWWDRLRGGALPAGVLPSRRVVGRLPGLRSSSLPRAAWVPRLVAGCVVPGPGGLALSARRRHAVTRPVTVRCRSLPRRR